MKLPASSARSIALVKDLVNCHNLKGVSVNVIAKTTGLLVIVVITELVTTFVNVMALVKERVNDNSRVNVSVRSICCVINLTLVKTI